MGQAATMPMGQPSMVATSEPISTPMQAAAVVHVPDAPVLKQNNGVGNAPSKPMLLRIVRLFIIAWFVILGHIRPFGAQF
jgi:hypothetical protein